MPIFKSNNKNLNAAAIAHSEKPSRRQKGKTFQVISYPPASPQHPYQCLHGPARHLDIANGLLWMPLFFLEDLAQ